MQKQKGASAGILLFRDQPVRSFLLMRHKKQWDLPKGHVERGETELEAALRELGEETGIPASSIQLDPTFRFELKKFFKGAYVGALSTEKSFVVFLGTLTEPVEIVPTEHEDFQWFAWDPPHPVDQWLIGPLLEAVHQHFSGEASS